MEAVVATIDVRSANVGQRGSDDGAARPRHNRNQTDATVTTTPPAAIDNSQARLGMSHIMLRIVAA